jgi:hypothetical protein
VVGLAGALLPEELMEGATQPKLQPRKGRLQQEMNGVIADADTRSGDGRGWASCWCWCCLLVAAVWRTGRGK